MNLMSFLYQFFLTLIALSLSIVIFLVKKEFSIFSDFSICFITIHPVGAYLFYLFVCTMLAYLSLLFAKKLSDDSIKPNTIKSLEPASDAFLPSYLGYFFVSLSIDSVTVFIAVFGIITILIFFSRAAYFNPLYFIFGYRFYYATTDLGAKILIITKRKLKIPKDVSFESIKRINDFTFIDIQGDER